MQTGPASRTAPSESIYHFTFTDQESSPGKRPTTSAHDFSYLPFTDGATWLP